VSITGLGLGLGNLLIQIFNVLLVLAWIGLAIYCLIQLRKQSFSASAKALWTMIIIVIPLVGAIAFLIVQPRE
jgi:putative copper export protein